MIELINEATGHIRSALATSQSPAKSDDRRSMRDALAVMAACKNLAERKERDLDKREQKKLTPRKMNPKSLANLTTWRGHVDAAKANIKDGDMSIRKGSALHAAASNQ